MSSSREDRTSGGSSSQESVEKKLRKIREYDKPIKGPYQISAVEKIRLVNKMAKELDHLDSNEKTRIRSHLTKKVYTNARKHYEQFIEDRNFDLEKENRPPLVPFTKHSFNYSK